MALVPYTVPVVSGRVTVGVVGRLMPTKPSDNTDVVIAVGGMCRRSDVTTRCSRFWDPDVRCFARCFVYRERSMAAALVAISERPVAGSWLA